MRATAPIAVALLASMVSITYSDAFCCFGVKKPGAFSSRFHSTSESRRVAQLWVESSLKGNEECCGEQQQQPESPETPTYPKSATITSSGEEIFPFDPRYSSQGPVGLGTFVVTREGPTTKEELTNENLLKIVTLECNDLEVSSNPSFRAILACCS